MNDVPCVSFSVACNTRKKDAQGKPIANFFRVTAWRALGEVCAKYLHKGDKVCVHGDLLVQEYVDRQGTTRTSLQVTASEIEFCTVRSQAEKAPQNSGAPTVDATAAEDELPF